MCDFPLSENSIFPTKYSETLKYSILASLKTKEKGEIVFVCCAVFTNALLTEPCLIDLAANLHRIVEFTLYYECTGCFDQNLLLIFY